MVRYITAWSVLVASLLNPLAFGDGSEKAHRGRENTPVIRHPNLDFRSISIYRGGVSDIADFHFKGCISYTIEKLEKKGIPEGGWLHEDRAKNKMVVAQLCFWEGDKKKEKKPLATYIARIDFFLKHLDPDLVYAIVLEDESVSWAPGTIGILNDLYDYIKEKYGYPVYQFETPIQRAPILQYKADGYVIDPYGVGKEDYRRIVLKHLITDKPVLPILFCGDHGPYSWPKFKSSTWEQVEICREFNLPMIFYCVDERGSVGSWMRNERPEIVDCRQTYLKARELAHATKPGELPLPSADHSIAAPIKIAGNSENVYNYNEDFTGRSIKLIDDATIDGFYNLRLDWNNKTLYIEPKKGRRTLLTYRFFSDFEISGIESSLSGQMKGECEISLSLSLDGNDWTHTAKVKGKPGEQLKGGFNITSTGIHDEEFKGKHFYARIAANLDSDKDSFISLDQFDVRAYVTPPEKKQILLKSDAGELVCYEDDFQSQNYLHLAHIVNEDRIMWRPGAIGIYGLQGRRNNAILKQKFICEAPLQKLSVVMSGYANMKSLASWNTLSFSLDGQQKVKETTTKDKPTDKYGRCREPLVLSITKEELSGRRAFWIIMEMHSNSEIKTVNPTNTITELKLEGSLEVD